MAGMDAGGGAPRGHDKKKKKKKKMRRVSVRIDMTPMVDVAFLLLTFFMLTTSMNRPQTMEINLPPKDVDIDIKDDGTISITSASVEGSAIAVSIIEGITEEAQIDKVYTGQVDKIMAYGAFVDVSENISGLLHVSEMSENFVKDPNAIVKEGQIVKVKVTKIDGEGRISFSMKGVPQS